MPYIDTGAVRCTRTPACEPTATERVMSIATGLPLTFVHAFMCTWEEYAGHVLDGYPAPTRATEEI
jgi:hypothetical protein